MEDNYAERMQHEIAKFAGYYKDSTRMYEPDTWAEVEKHFADAMERSVGVRNLYSYVARWAEGRKSVSILGLGSGACGNELNGIFPLLQERGCAVELTCCDINQSMLDTAASEAASRGIAFEGIVQDANLLDLPERRYDVIVCYASLHHFIDLDRVASQINRALKDDGIFVTVDIPSRNGYLMWDETFDVVNSIFAVLPPQYRISHTSQATPVQFDELENVDYSVGSFECINSEAIMPALRKHLREIDYVPALAFSRRFFDHMFGPNFDLTRPLDQAIFEFITTLDRYYIENNYLRPETFFGAYGKKAVPESGAGRGLDLPEKVVNRRLGEKRAAIEERIAEDPRVKQLEAENSGLREQLEARSAEIERLQFAEEQLRAIGTTRAWKVMGAYWRFRDKLRGK